MNSFFVVVLPSENFSVENIVALCDSETELDSLINILDKDTFYEIYRGVKYFNGMPFTYPWHFVGYIKNNVKQLRNLIQL